MRALTPQDLRGLSPEAMSELAEQMLAKISAQSKLITEQAQAIKFKDVKLERIMFELARLKRWKFAAKAEHMNAEQRQMFEEAMAEDQASLEAQLLALQGNNGSTPTPPAAHEKAPRKPRREKLPDHLRRVDYLHEPADTDCPTAGCGQAMVRIGEDITEKLDIVPAEFFVHRHVRGKWACKCCQILVQEPVAPQIIDRGMPAAGLLAHTLVSRFVDHLPYHRQEQINARSGVHTPRSTLAAWAGQTGAQLESLYDAHRAFVLGSQVLHVDETLVAMLDPGAGKTKRAYVWAYARGAFDAAPGVAYDFRASRAARHPVEFLQGWSGTLVCDGYAVYDSVVKLEQRSLAGCAAHARRKFEEVAKDRHSPVATEALQRIAWLYRIEREIKELSAEDRLGVRQARSVPLWKELHVWLRLERQRVPDGSAIAQAIDYSLNRWGALTRHLHDGDVPVDNNHCENLIRPWAMGRKAWLFAGSELAGQRAAMIMSLLQSAKLNGHDPWAYLKDVLTRLPTQLNSRIDELLPHRWQQSI
ncbi:IS66 family transposase [Variovorax sp. J31P216]|uniref:IS66 family transposase n=1 Tax=Variovorax saccharolyticus TaxID=3053516 RepID=UPI0025788013|nr:IS66 family transposase [Variovorax sp. J31P216]MDM0030510.1 IS66 family transposase [Variovorax sp. J31P216]